MDRVTDARCTGGQCGRRPAATWLVVLALLVVATAAGQARAQEAGGPDWEPTGLNGAVLQLFAPASGAFFARTADGLARSDDAGTTWAPVRLPPAAAQAGRGQAAVDPTDHRVWYVAGADGLYKTEDDAASWRLVLSPAGAERFEAIAVSPAAPPVVYAALVRPQSSFRFLRSRNGGSSWEELEQAGTNLCGWSVSLLSPHPTDANRVIRSAGCYAGRNFGGNLRQSMDQGATWQDLFALATRRAPGRPVNWDMGYPTRLVGGQGAAPRRWYLGARRDSRVGGSMLFRSDDDGNGWAAVLGFAGGGTDTGTQRTLELGPDAPEVEIGGLADDPAQPDRIYVGLNDCVGHFSQRTCAGRVTASSDGGATWAGLGERALAKVNDLALGIDGLNVYAATDEGLWRLRLDH